MSDRNEPTRARSRSRQTEWSQAKWQQKDVFSTGEAADICGVSQQTIIRCFDSGLLDGFRVPGSKFRRIPKGSLLQFMRENRLSTDALDMPRMLVLVVDEDVDTAERVKHALASEAAGGIGCDVRTAESAFEAGLVAGRLKPDVVVLGRLLRDMSGVAVCRRIKSDPELRATRVLLVSDAASEQTRTRLAADGADGVIEKRADVETFGRAIAALLQRRRVSARPPEPGEPPPPADPA